MEETEEYPTIMLLEDMNPIKKKYILTCKQYIYIYCLNVDNYFVTHCVVTNFIISLTTKKKGMLLVFS